MFLVKRGWADARHRYKSNFMMNILFTSLESAKKEIAFYNGRDKRFDSLYEYLKDKKENPRWFSEIEDWFCIPSFRRTATGYIYSFHFYDRNKLDMEEVLLTKNERYYYDDEDAYGDATPPRVMPEESYIFEVIDLDKLERR